MNITRQQRRKDKRKRNKEIRKEGRSLIGKKLLDPRDKDDFEKFTASSNSTSIMPFCIGFNKHNDLNDYAFSCREGAEAFIDNDHSKFVCLIREPGVEFPAPKRELMKIGTRIFYKKAPNRAYIFLEVEGTPENADIYGAIGDFMMKLSQVPEGAGPPDWLSEYIYREADN